MITDWLRKPYLLSVTEQQQVADLLHLYPYLVPARWMQASASFAHEGFSKDVLHDSQLFAGNWMQFYLAMQDSLKSEKPQSIEIAIPAEELKEQHTGTTHQELLNDTQTGAASEALVMDMNVSLDDAAEIILDQEETIMLDDTLDDKETIAHQDTEIEALELAPVFAENYFLHQGIEVPDTIPLDLDKAMPTEKEEEDTKSLMVVMGFDEWLRFLKRKNEAKLSEEEDKAIVRSIWQREKLAAAMGEEDDNIPEAVFEMAINSINKQEIMVSEPLAEILVKQGRFDKAIEVYKKLSLQNPEKKTYFAAKINHLNKEKLL
ncbi:MAG: hypothetical protein QM530_06015 [Phycisphaerales bacterium]|nr:hypothetical protein [Phycisphaerales bacterium]